MTTLLIAFATVLTASDSLTVTVQRDTDDVDSVSYTIEFDADGSRRVSVTDGAGGRWSGAVPEERRDLFKFPDRSKLEGLSKACGIVAAMKDGGSYVATVTTCVDGKSQTFRFEGSQDLVCAMLGESSELRTCDQLIRWQANSVGIPGARPSKIAYDARWMILDHPSNSRSAYAVIVPDLSRDRKTPIPSTPPAGPKNNYEVKVPALWLKREESKQ